MCFDSNQLELFPSAIASHRPISTAFQRPGADYILPAISLNDQVSELLQQHAPVAIGVSGGKDSSVAAVKTIQYLDKINHTGPRVLIHADLGRIEWAQSVKICQQLADRLGLELIVVRRLKGDMVDRWLQRWADNVRRYVMLECVRLIMPWSSAAWRFCTSELKSAIIARDLISRFPGQPILSVVGIRRWYSSSGVPQPGQKAYFCR